jgi:non-heme chloroperoxidase
MGTGELARYLGAYGAKRVRSAVFLASLPPFLLQTPDNPAGLDGSVFDGMQRRLAADRPGYLSAFLAECFDLGVLGTDPLTRDAVARAWTVAMQAPLRSLRDCVTAWTTDFRADCRRVDVPALLVHGDADRILPLAATARPLHERLRTSRLVVLDGAPHGFPLTHAERVNRELLAFLAERS